MDLSTIHILYVGGGTLSKGGVTHTITGPSLNGETQSLNYHPTPELPPLVGRMLQDWADADYHHRWGGCCRIGLMLNSAGCSKEYGKHIRSSCLKLKGYWEAEGTLLHRLLEVEGMLGSCRDTGKSRGYWEVWGYCSTVCLKL